MGGQGWRRRAPPPRHADFRASSAVGHRHQGQDCPWLGCHSSYLEWCSNPGHPRRASCRERRLRSADPFRVSHPQQAHRQRDVLSHPVGCRAQQRTSSTHTMADTRNNLAGTEMALSESVYQEKSHCAHRQLLQTCHLQERSCSISPKDSQLEKD